ncbi:MAG: (Fe-S)-binding protein [Alphaproteobacteria bacterium]|nr:MAG: (Fe-S)-binding protein [Alphaproteobacteria bacterium]
MSEMTFESALAARVDDMLDACTKCGACFTACPITGAAGIADADPQAVVSGVLDIVRPGAGPEASRNWASSCIMSGECIKACDYGVNPRFLLSVARLAMAKAKGDPVERRRTGVENFRKLNQDVTVLSRLQLSDAALERLGQRPSTAPLRAEPEREPDVVFYTGCNVLKTPHIPLLCLDIMDALGVSYRVMGGPTHCCGVLQLRAGDADTSGRFAGNTIDKLATSKSGEVVSWCPSCFVQFTEVMLPTFERAGREKPFDMTPFMRFLRRHLDELRPLLRQRVALRVALHKHPGISGVVEAAEDILRALPGIELVDLHQPAVGLQSFNLAMLPAYKRELQLKELEAAREAGIEALATIYHSDQRELCAHERDWPFRIVNLLELVGQSMGFAHEDHYKHLKITQDADAILAECSDLIAQHGLDPVLARNVVINGMIADQPLPLVGAGVP